LAEHNRIIELSEGELILPPMPTTEHQDIVGAIYILVRAFVRAHNLGKVGLSPLPLRLWEGKVREPDVMVMLRKHAERIGNQYWEQPDLVVEVLSPGTAKTDRSEKVVEYAAAGIPEYWMVHPDPQVIEVYRLEGEAYVLDGVYRGATPIVSHVLAGLAISVDDIWNER
jgi:Uma2 family endonuclease